MLPAMIAHRPGCVRDQYAFGIDEISPVGQFFEMKESENIFSAAIEYSRNKIPSKGCPCGKDHLQGVDRLEYGFDCIEKLPQIIEQHAHRRITVVADRMTAMVFGLRCVHLLERSGFDVRSFVFDDEFLIPDEQAIGRLVTGIDPATSILIAVGSGTINDLTRYVSFRIGIPYIIVATAPSMDGYLSSLSPLIVDRIKKTYSAAFPVAVVADLRVLTEAPPAMIKAGFGDIVGKITSLADWSMSHNVAGGYYCENIAALTREALNLCLRSAEGISRGDAEAVENLMDALLASGLAMGYAGNSQPASGAEHHLAHFWDMDAISHGRRYPLHGESVGVASVVVAELYQMAKGFVPSSVQIPDPEIITSTLSSAGCVRHPEELGITRSLFLSSLREAMHLRPHYTILRHIESKGLLESYAVILAKKYYKGE
ncbi:MAG TPA: sn-glycerol-1-phosphate dehydrogenase [Spirochaetota bacterium]